MATQAVIFADTDGVIREWNAGAEAIFGHKVDDAVGASLDLIVPAHLQARHWSGFHRAMKKPQIKDLAADLPVHCADGEVRTFAGRLLVVSDALGAPLGAMALHRPWHHGCPTVWMAAKRSRQRSHLAVAV